jgi:hypothetical protein
MRGRWREVEVEKLLGSEKQTPAAHRQGVVDRQTSGTLYGR